MVYNWQLFLRNVKYECTGELMLCDNISAILFSILISEHLFLCYPVGNQNVLTNVMEPSLHKQWSLEYFLNCQAEWAIVYLSSPTSDPNNHFVRKADHGMKLRAAIYLVHALTLHMHIEERWGFCHDKVILQILTFFYHWDDARD